MRRQKSFPALLLAGLVLASCEGRTDKTDGGGVTLVIESVDTVFFGVSVNTAVHGDPGEVPCLGGGFVCVDGINLRNVVKDPTGSSSDLMTVEIQSYEVRFTRADSGTRVPPALVRATFGSVTPGGTFSIQNLPIMSDEQLEGRPLSDLLFENGGFDQETGLTRIKLNMTIRFFGRTLSGDAVESAPAGITVDFVP